MRKLDEVDVLKKLDSKRERLLAVHLMLHQQFDVLEKIMESNIEFVDSPLSYNACAGLLEQARGMAIAAFNGGVHAAPTYPDGIKPSNFGSII